MSEKLSSSKKVENLYSFLGWSSKGKLRYKDDEFYVIIELLKFI